MAKRVSLLPRWRQLLVHAWSMRFVYAAAATLVASEIVDWLREGDAGIYLPPWASLALRLIGIALTFAAIPARIIIQKELHNEQSS